MIVLLVGDMVLRVIYRQTVIVFILAWNSELIEPVEFISVALSLVDVPLSQVFGRQ